MTALIRGLLLCCALATPTTVGAADTDLSAAIAEARARQPAPPLPRERFLVPPALSEVVLSPDGRQIAALAARRHERDLWWQGPGDDAPRRVLARAAAGALVWSRDSRWLFVVSPEQVLVMDAARGGKVRVIARLAARHLHEPLGADPSRDGAVLVLEQTPFAATRQRSRLLRLAADGRTEVLHEGEPRLLDAVLSPDGQRMVLRRLHGDAHEVLEIRAGSIPRPRLRCVQLERCSLLALADDGTLWLHADAGADFSRLLRLSADGRRHTAHVDPRGESDLDAVVFDPEHATPRWVGYRSTGPRMYGLDAPASATLSQLEAHFPGRDLRLMVGRASWLVGEFDDTLPQPRWFRYRPDEDRLERVMATLDGVAAAPPEEALADKLAVSWQASDGRRMHGFVALPPGRDPATVPLVTSVHGGPWSAAGPEYSGLTQFFVNRGFAVFLPNFRGSTGLGRDHVFAAQGDFGDGRVFRDIVEGTRHVLAQGIGDARRVAIQGGSFGGYAALQGVTYEPDLFRLALAAAPPADFGWAARWATTGSDLSRAHGLPLASLFRALSVDVDDAGQMARLHAQSPLARAAELRRPVLLFAGGRDERVALRSVTHYAALLRRQGKDITVYIEPDAGHALDAALTREAYLYLSEWLLHRHLGGEPPMPPSPALRAHLQRHLRLPEGGALATAAP